MVTCDWARRFVPVVALAGVVVGWSSNAAAATPYGGTPAPIPGTIQAANFDEGGEGVAYHDWTPGNSGGAYRSTDVDIEADQEGGYDVGWVGSGEWLNYTVNVGSSGSYTVTLRLASPNGASLHVGFNGPSAGTWKAVTVPATGAWQNWTDVSVNVTLGAGIQQMTVMFDTSGVNFASATVSGGSSTTGSAASSGGPGPYGGTPAAVPGRIDAANFDNGGEGTGYHDTTGGNAGGAYRSTDVDIEPSSEGGYDIGWTVAGEWLNYTVNVASAGGYTAQVRVASPGGGSLHIGFNGPSAGTWQLVSVPATGGWQSWTTVSVPVTLGAGQQQMTVMFDTGGLNLENINIAAGSVVSASGGSSSSASSGSGGGGVRMMTWNVRSGTDLWQNYVLPQQVQFMASQNADVIVLQEVSTYDEYQPTKYRDLLQQATGQTWYYVFAPGTACLTGGCIGEEILSRIPIADSTTTFLTPSSAARALINVGGVPINILTCHLEAYDLSLRTAELNGLMSWGHNFGGPRIVGGDFNSWWGEWWIGQMETEYSDSWTDTGHPQDGAYTIGNVRFDYLFRSFDGGWRLTPTNAWVADTTLSDHRPFIADYRAQ